MEPIPRQPFCTGKYLVVKERLASRSGRTSQSRRLADLRQPAGLPPSYICMAGSARAPSRQPPPVRRLAPPSSAPSPPAVPGSPPLGSGCCSTAGLTASAGTPAHAGRSPDPPNVRLYGPWRAVCSLDRPSVASLSSGPLQWGCACAEAAGSYTCTRPISHAEGRGVSSCPNWPPSPAPPECSDSAAGLTASASGQRPQVLRRSRSSVPPPA
jgi:hypothetical protein